VAPLASALDRIKHVIVVMLENRSFDHVYGFLYDDRRQPQHFLPEATPRQFNGMPRNFSNPSNPEYFKGNGPPNAVPVHAGTSNRCVPHEDPQELFEQINFQLFGTTHPSPEMRPSMNGFLVSYQDTKPASPEEIMQCFLPEQLPVTSALAWNFAICDEWYASAPCQTWPNRAFFHLGTSRGQVNNYPYDTFAYDVPTIFNVLQDQKISWAVFNDSILESATRLQFPQLWDLLLEPHFQRFDAFERDARNGRLPAYSFVEPSFVFEPNDAHPPHDMLAAEQFLWRVWNAVSTGAHWDSTLLIITYDEHGGCIDHQPPPANAVPPDECRGPDGFAFDRYGVRVPAIVVSPWIEPGTVFRPPTATPYCHTSVIATLRDWLKIPIGETLKSRRVELAPTLEHLLTRPTPRTEIPAIPYPEGKPSHHPMHLAPNDFQKGLMVSLAHRLGLRGGVKLLSNVRHRQHVADFFETYKERHRH
jgi:phospholipase C